MEITELYGNIEYDENITTRIIGKIENNEGIS
jgi:hypothetical protein